MEAVDHLKSAGLKTTLPRLKVLALFEQSRDRHLSADDVYRHMMETGEEMGLATVYRILSQFEQAGILTRLQLGDKAVFELASDDHHDHIVCLQCGHVEEFFEPKIEELQHKIAKQHGFVLRDHALYLYVDCTRESCPHRKNN